MAKTKTSTEREVTMKSAFKFLILVMGIMAVAALIVETWPVSGLVIAVLLICTLLYIKKGD